MWWFVKKGPRVQTLGQKRRGYICVWWRTKQGRRIQLCCLGGGNEKNAYGPTWLVVHSPPARSIGLETQRWSTREISAMLSNVRHKRKNLHCLKNGEFHGTCYTHIKKKYTHTIFVFAALIVLSSGTKSIVMFLCQLNREGMFCALHEWLQEHRTNVTAHHLIHQCVRVCVCSTVWQYCKLWH